MVCVICGRCDYCEKRERERALLVERDRCCFLDNIIVINTSRKRRLGYRKKRRMLMKSCHASPPTTPTDTATASPALLLPRPPPHNVHGLSGLAAWFLCTGRTFILAVHVVSCCLLWFLHSVLILAPPHDHTTTSTTTATASVQGAQMKCRERKNQQRNHA